MKLLVVIPFCKSDGALAEKMIDWIYYLNERKQDGYCLLVPASDVHAELVTKVQISAEVTFNSVAVLPDKSPADGSKYERLNRLFSAVLEYVNKNYHWPFLWLEPDCVPLKRDWLSEIADAYESQPRRYLGAYLKYSNPDRVCLSRIAVYPSDAAKDLLQHCKSNMPYNVSAGDGLTGMAEKSILFQQMDYKGEQEKVRANTALLHSDKKGQLMAALKHPKALTT